MRKYVKFMIVPLIAVGFILGMVAGSQAAVNLDASAAMVTVPAERTQKVGPPAAAAGSGGARLQGGQLINWIAGQNYASGNRMKLTLPTAAGSRSGFAGTWYFEYSVAGGVSTLAMNGVSKPTMIVQLNTNDIVQSDTIEIMGSNSVLFGSTGLCVDVASVVGEQTINLTGVLLTSGLGTVDPPDADPLVRTLYQYSNSNAGAATATIDAINHVAQLFSGSTRIAGPHAFRIDSGNQFAGPLCNAPTFRAGDQLELTLNDNQYAFAGLASVAFTGNGGAITKGLGSASNAVYTLSAANLALIATAKVGMNNTDINFNISLLASGNTQLRPRTININSVKLGLTATGNGTRDLGNYGTAFNLTQNGTLFRANYMRYDSVTSQNMYYKFSNDSGQAVTVELRYHDRTATTQGSWTTYGETIPAYGVLAINKQDVDGALGLGQGNYNGWIEFRLHTQPANVTGVINAKFADTWFNIPMHLYDSDQPAGVAAAGKWIN